MTRRYVVCGLGFAAALAIIPVGGRPAVARFFGQGVSIAQSLNQPKVELKLIAKQKRVEKDAQGKEQVSWSEIKQDVTVKKGTVLRLQVLGHNTGDRPAEKLVVTQPVPRGTVYTIGSATQENAELDYSVDGGKTYSPNPMVVITLPDGRTGLQPAPADTYSHVRWTFSRAIAPQSGVEVSYEVSVQ
ncbi:MAG: hypothetical protein MUC48_04375 [Leptolyngbya sp. Prado105]|jgi:uncharacterized repeat protein (TIGR01451 family)|nr:hypothetical protein [Leptolyngbya sp. Prado105]